MRALAKKLFSFHLGLLILCRGQALCQATTPQKDLTLLEAIELTLRNHPLIRSQLAQVQISRGLQEQAAGLFDSLITSSFNQSRATIPLSLFQQLTGCAIGIAQRAADIQQHQLQCDFPAIVSGRVSVTPQFQLAAHG